MQADDARRRGTETGIALAAQGPTQGSYTAKQGQYLAFIYYYTKIHGRSPSEADMQGYFRVSPPAVHQMVLSLEKLQQLESAIGAYRAGARCQCGAPIWIIGSAQTGLGCFACITGQTAPDHDYEIDVADEDTAS